MSEEEERKHNIFLNIILVCVIVAIASSFYLFYFIKNYDFFVETKCNPEMETCFYRDCVGVPDLCPPNNLSYYNQYTIKSRDFKVCVNEDCSYACSNNIINCIKTECTENDINDGVCMLPTNSEDQN